jgi:ribosomal protein L11 methyltransferase
MKTEKTWFALDFTVDAEASEAVEFALNELGALGTEINHLGVKQTKTLTVSGYFNELPADKTVQAELLEALRIYEFTPAAIKKTQKREIENVDWLLEWKKHWKATETGRFIVAPTWENVEENTGKIIIRIEPNMAFGTGTHETTRLCLSAIEKSYQSGMSFLDVGTGTGILAIAAAKLNKKLKIENFKLIGYDTDFDSIAIAKENAELNEVSGKVEFRVGSISENDSEYDFVCANITVDVIVPILAPLLKKSKKILALSGILKEQEDLIVSKLKNFGIENPEIETFGEWISVLIKR